MGAKIAAIVGAKPSEVVIADSTSINLFKLILGAMQANSEKKVIVSDEMNFPSNLHAIHAANKLLGGRHIIRLMTSEDGIGISDDELESAIRPDVGLVVLTQTAFKSGFTYEIESVTRRAHDVGAFVLWDLSHSVGAMPIDLNNWEVDLAVGSTYKYLNGGPGSPAFLYVRERLLDRLGNPLAGWFGQRNQFTFSTEYEPADGIKQFLTGTPPILSIAPIGIGADICLRAGTNRIRKKSIGLTNYFIQLAKEALLPLGIKINSPDNPDKRGSHVSLGHFDAYAIDRALIQEMKVIPDFRNPDNIRFGLAPLYTTYAEIHQTISRVRTVLETEVYKRYRMPIAGVT